jgi:hypothetical protein
MAEKSEDNEETDDEKTDSYTQDEAEYIDDMVSVYAEEF